MSTSFVLLMLPVNDSDCGDSFTPVDMEGHSACAPMHGYGDEVPCIVEFRTLALCRVQRAVATHATPPGCS